MSKRSNAFFTLALAAFISFALFSCSKSNSAMTKHSNSTSSSNFTGNYSLSGVFLGGTEAGKNLLNNATSSGSFAVTPIDPAHIHLVLKVSLNGQSSTGAEDAIITGPDAQLGTGYTDFKQSDNKGNDTGFFESGAGEVFLNFTTTDSLGNKYLFKAGPKS